jgi:hypothetical protein
LLAGHDRACPVSGTQPLVPALLRRRHRPSPLVVSAVAFVASEKVLSETIEQRLASDRESGTLLFDSAAP